MDDKSGDYFIYYWWLCVLCVCFFVVTCRIIFHFISTKCHQGDRQANEVGTTTSPIPSTQQQEQQHTTENTTTSAQLETLNIITSIIHNNNTSMGMDSSTSQPRNDPSAATECTLNLIEIGTSLPSECTICLEDFHGDNSERINQHGGNHKICMLHECKHMFHADCIKMWVNSKMGISTHTCPNCRVSLSSPRFNTL